MWLYGLEGKMKEISQKAEKGRKERRCTGSIQKAKIQVVEFLQKGSVNRDIDIYI